MPTTPASNGPAADPVGVRTMALLSGLGCPADLVKTAAAAAPGWADLPPTHYADDGRGYPVHDALAAVVSAACYLAGGDADAAVGVRIKRACQRFGLGHVWDGLAKRAAAAPAPAEPPYALPAKKKYPLGTPAQVKAAAAYLAEHADAFTPADRRAYAANVLRADAGALGTYERAGVEQAAGLGRPAGDPARAFTARKAAAHGDPEAYAAVVGLEREYKRAGDHYAAADALRALDRARGWELPDPGPLLTGLTPAVAGKLAADYAVAPGGAWYRKSDLDRVPLQDLRDAFGLGPVVPRSKRAELLAEHPDTYPAFLADYGVRPAHMPAAARAAVDWDALAAE
jgi:hypothetical protein